MAWSSKPKDPQWVPRVGWWADPTVPVRASSAEWYNPHPARHSDNASSGTLTATARQLERVSVTLGGDGSVALGNFKQIQPVAGVFENLDSSQTGKLISGLSAWSFASSKANAVFSGSMAFTPSGTAYGDGLTVVVGRQYQSAPIESGDGTLSGIAIYAIYEIGEDEENFSGTGSFGVLEARPINVYPDGLYGAAWPLGTTTEVETGVGTFSGAISQIYSSAPQFASAGSLSASRFVALPTAPAFASAGSLTAAAVGQRVGIPALSGGGSLSATAVPQRSAALTLTGSGTISGTASQVYSSSVTITGTGALTSTAFAKYAVAPQFSSSGNFIPGYYPGTDGLWASAFASYSRTDATTSVGTLSATVSQIASAAGALASTGSLSATARMYSLSIAAGLSGTGSLTATTVAQRNSAPALAGVGALTQTNTTRYYELRSATLTGAGTLVGAASGQVTQYASPALSGSGTLTSVARMYQIGRAATLSGVGALTSTQFQALPTAPAFTGSGTLTATAVARYVADFVEIAEGADYENTAVPIYSWGGGAYSTEQALSGTHSWKWSSPGWNGPFLRQSGTSPFSPGRRVDIRTKVRPHASNNTSAGYLTVAARFFTDEARTTYTDSAWVTIANSALSAGWQELNNLGIISPANTLSVEMWVLCSSDTPAGNAYYIDDVSVRIPPLLISDGALSGAARMFQTASAATLAGSGSLSATATGTLSAVTVNAVGTGNRTTGSSTSMTVTGTCNAATSGTTTWAVVGVVMSTSNARNGSCDCTYGGVAMTKVGFASWGTSGTIHIFALQNPATGSQNVTATDSTSTPNYTAMALQTVVYNGASSVTGFTSAASLSITTATVPTSARAFATHINGASISAVNQTERYRTGSSVSGTGDYIAVQDAAGAGSTITFTASGTATTPGSAYVVISP